MHLIAQSESLSTDLKRLKSFTAKALIEFLQERNAKTLLDQLKFYKKAHKDQSEFQFWQEGSHPELMANEMMMRQKIDYVHMNPVKRGYIDLPEHWRYSSARHYLGLEGLLDVDLYK